MKKGLFSVSYAGLWGQHALYEMCSPVTGGGEENLDRKARAFLSYMQGVS